MSSRAAKKLRKSYDKVFFAHIRETDDREKQAIRKLHKEVQAVARELGYPKDEVDEAMAYDPLKTVEYLMFLS